MEGLGKVGIWDYWAFVELSTYREYDLYGWNKPKATRPPNMKRILSLAKPKHRIGRIWVLD